MEAFEPDLIRNVFGEEDEYSEDLRGRLASSPVFEQANQLQSDLLTTRLTEESFISAWNASHEFIGSLETNATQQGVMYENVAVRGEGIRVPKFEIDFAANVAMVSLVDREKREESSFDNYFRPDEYRGKFAGFTVHFVEDKENSGVYVPVLAYQISMQAAYGPHAHISLFATADVGTTQLYFDKDNRFEGSLEPLDTLFRLCSDKADMIDLINMPLARTETYNAAIMRRVGYRAEKLINSLDEETKFQAEDAVADLISHYIGRSSSYLLQTDKFCLSASSLDEMKEYYEAETEGALYTVHNTCLDVVFLNRAIIKEGEVEYLNNRTAHLVMPNGNRNIFVPLTSLQQFTKQ
jgi:hypothetical protein